MGGLKSAGGSLERWKEIVTRYTQCKLTFSEDKLVAFAGIARVVYEEHGFEYLAGMWKPWLIDLLPWHLDTNDKHHKPSPYRAPSWSWAAIDGTVYNGRLADPTGKYFAHVLEARVTPVGIDTFGQVENGTLELCCSHILPGRLSTLGGAGTFTISKIDYDVSVDMDYLRTSEWTDLATVLVPILMTSRGTSSVICLVLQSTGGARGEYYRVGSYHYFPQRYGLPWDNLSHGQRILFDLFYVCDQPRTILDELRAQAADLACEKQDSTHPDSPFVITII